MTEIDGYDEQITSDLNKYEAEVKALEKKEFAQKQSAISKIEKLKKSINTLIESFEMEINQLEKNKSALYKESIKAINKKFQNLNYAFEQAKNAQSGQGQLFDGRNQNMSQLEMSSGQLIELGHKTQQESADTLRAVLLKVNEGNVLLDETSKALDSQIEQLARMENTVRDTRSVLNRSQKYLRYFARQVYTDKLLMTLICLIAVVVVAIILCSVMGYDMKKIKDQII